MKTKSMRDVFEDSRPKSKEIRVRDPKTVECAIFARQSGSQEQHCPTYIGRTFFSDPGNVITLLLGGTLPGGRGEFARPKFGSSL
jgi:hypothetical protein